MRKASKIPAGVKAILFDAGGTLFRPYPSVGHHYRSVAVKYGCTGSEEEIEAAFHRVWRRHDVIGGFKSHTDAKKEREFWHRIVGEVFKDLPPLSDFESCFEELYDLFARPEVWRFFPESEEVLQALKDQGYILGLVSNWDSRLEKLCEGLGLDRFMEFYLISAIFGAAKPDPKIFEAALKKAGVKAEEAVHIGDSLEDDIHGAHRVGIKAIWLDRSGRHQDLEAHQREILTVVKDLKELL